MIFLRFGGLLILLYYSISSLISEDYFGQINQLNLIGSLNLFTQVVIIISIVFLVYGLVTSLNDIKEQSMGIFKYLRYTLSKNVPHSPHDIWRFLQGSVADIQMYNTIRNLSAIDGMYIPLQMNHLHGLYEPASRRMRTTLTETAPTYYFVSFQVYT